MFVDVYSIYRSFHIVGEQSHETRRIRGKFTNIFFFLGEIIHKRLRSSNLFRSRIGADVLCDSVRQSVEFCFDLSRDLLMLCTLITKFGQQVTEANEVVV